MPIAFGLVGALVAFAILRASEAYALDPLACHVGVFAAAILGTLTAWAVHHLRRRPRWTHLRWGLVPAAGALVGMSVQASLLRTPIVVVGSTVGLTKADPASWILVGAPVGAAPALLVALLLRLSLQAMGRIPPLDARERMIVPASGVCLVLATASLAFAGPLEMPAVVLALVLALAALVEVVVRDLTRARWLTRVFAGGTTFDVVPLDEAPATDLPPFIGGAPIEAAIVARGSASDYRTTNRALLAVTASHLASALAPLRRRRQLAAVFLALALFAGGIDTLVR
jgi:hypothetical protein